MEATSATFDAVIPVASVYKSKGLGFYRIVNIRSEAIAT